MEASRLLLQLCSVLNTKTSEKIASHLLPRENVKHNYFNIAKQITEVGDVYVKIHQKFVMLRNFIVTATFFRFLPAAQRLSLIVRFVGFVT